MILRHFHIFTCSHVHKINFAFFISLFIVCSVGLLTLFFVSQGSLGSSTALIMFALIPIGFLIGIYCTYCAIIGMIRASENNSYF
jgi:hypothetical protein